MAEASGVTEVDLKAKIIGNLQATHVEIEDMSGTFPAPLYPSSFIAIWSISIADKLYRWLRPGFFSCHSIASI